MLSYFTFNKKKKKKHGIELIQNAEQILVLFNKINNQRNTRYHGSSHMSTVCSCSFRLRVSRSSRSLSDHRHKHVCMISSVVNHKFTPAQLESLKSGLHGVIGVSSITWATEKGFISTTRLETNNNSNSCVTDILCVLNR